MTPRTPKAYATAELAARRRAVAQACGANRLEVAIPCHRVVHSDRNHSNYRWGVERKRALMAHEAAGRRS